MDHRCVSTAIVMLLAANAAASVRGESVSAPAGASHQARRDIAFTPTPVFAASIAGYAHKIAGERGQTRRRTKRS